MADRAAPGNGTRHLADADEDPGEHELEGLLGWWVTDGFFEQNYLLHVSIPARRLVVRNVTLKKSWGTLERDASAPDAVYLRPPDRTADERWLAKCRAREAPALLTWRCEKHIGPGAEEPVQWLRHREEPQAPIPIRCHWPATGLRAPESQLLLRVGRPTDAANCAELAQLLPDGPRCGNSPAERQRWWFQLLSPAGAEKGRTVYVLAEQFCRSFRDRCQYPGVAAMLLLVDPQEVTDSDGKRLQQAEIQGLVVAQAHRQCGLAQLLIRHVTRQLPGCVRIVADVSSTPANRLFRKLGFVLSDQFAAVEGCRRLVLEPRKEPDR